MGCAKAGLTDRSDVTKRLVVQIIPSFEQTSAIVLAPGVHCQILIFTGAKCLIGGIPLETKASLPLTSLTGKVSSFWEGRVEPEERHVGLLWVDHQKQRSTVGLETG